ncbi:hypothetical protein O181_026922 [Austropuccinia psidii MF-1]|uniref:AB hydrolase-1 domain-containing protein n=1 Tax=Austropuccinia psidii MF-1 TaxID=1389203 RepID=A0A9Q3CP00_9BASI|nr:hypothetical protein [Austropuccinia psidii MF-1]
MTNEPVSLPTILDPETCIRKGVCLVGKQRSLPVRKLYYELHGAPTASQKIVLIMGVNFTCSAWSRQVHHFAKKPDHAVLVFDNRGVGNSECGVFERYRTSEMAKDTWELLNFLGWDQERSLHMFGVSMGGMILQELCQFIPKRMKSVTLISTRTGDVLDLPSFTIFKVFFRLVAKLVSPKQELPLLMDILFPKPHLDERIADGRTRKEELIEEFASWHNNPRQQSTTGVLGHFYAAHSHCCSTRTLNLLSKELKPAKITIITGDLDTIILPVRSTELHANLPGSELVVIKGAGHALSAQMGDEFNELMERVISEGNQAFCQH